MHKVFVAIQTHPIDGLVASIPDIPGVTAIVKDLEKVHDAIGEVLYNHLCALKTFPPIKVRDFDQLTQLSEYKDACWACLSLPSGLSLFNQDNRQQALGF